MTHERSRPSSDIPSGAPPWEPTRRGTLTDMTEHVAAAITAGGRSRRFGSDKALHAWRGRTLLEHVAASMSSFEPRILIAPASPYELPGWRAVPDTRPGEGPLAGLEAALRELDGWVAFAGVDLPALTPEYWAFLQSRASGDIVSAVNADGRPEPLAALYHASLLPRVTALLEGGERRLRAVLESARTTYVPWEDVRRTGRNVFLNVNRPNDLNGF